MPEMNTMFSRGMPRSGIDLLHGAQDRVVAAAGAPAHVLVGLEVLLGELVPARALLL